MKKADARSCLREAKVAVATLRRLLQAFNDDPPGMLSTIVTMDLESSIEAVEDGFATIRRYALGAKR